MSSSGPIAIAGEARLAGFSFARPKYLHFRTDTAYRCLYSVGKYGAARWLPGRKDRDTDTDAA